MSADINDPGNELDAGVVEEICGYLTEQPSRSFFLFAGAGSGKTRTLVEVLRRLTGVTPHKAGGKVARSLRLAGRSIRVVTYTKNAVAVINGRLGDNDLVKVSTIHSFCWELIEGFNSDIREALIAVAQAKLERDRAAAAAKPKGISDKDRVDFAEIEADIEAYRQTSSFRYHPDKNLYGAGAIQHAHVLNATAWILLNRPTLRRILQDRHPVVLIDESQDTMKSMLNALMILAEPRGAGLTLGLLGDHRQRIFSDGYEDLPTLVPEGWAKPELQMNHRSQRRIVDLINRVWEAKLEGRTQPANGVVQRPRTEKDRGTVRIFVGSTSLTGDDKAKLESWCAEQMADATQVEDWRDGNYQLLALEHKLVATRGSFLNVYQAMELLDPNAAAPVGSGENKGPSAARLLLDELAGLARCVRPDGSIDESAATDLLRHYGSLDGLPVDVQLRNTRIQEMHASILEFAKGVSNPDSTVREVLSPILAARLFDVDSRLGDAFADKSPPPPAPIPRKEKETTEARIRRGWCALFVAPWRELERYRRYLAGESELATHRIVKGSEFHHVMVVMDDKQAGTHQISYDKLFGAKSLSDTDLKHAENGKETTIDRSLRLLYVTCSRAKESLALVLWSEAPHEALKRIRDSGWFEAHEVQAIQPT
jgi:DNA helicase-2/ATP-dependent DNA helicase PcrA